MTRVLNPPELVEAIWSRDASVWTGADEAHWLGWLEPVFSEHPAFEKTEQFSRPHAGGDARSLYRLKDNDRVAWWRRPRGW